MKITVFFAWFDLWIGAYIDVEKTTLYICLLPMIVIKIEFIFCYQVIGWYTKKVIGYTWGYDGKMDVLKEEPMATFRRISRQQYRLAHRSRSYDR